jgi:hypothetical protein
MIGIGDFREFCANSCGNSEQLKKCAGCGSVSYCGKSCQKMHWKAHKQLCATVVKNQNCKVINDADDSKTLLQRFLYKIPPISAEYLSQFCDDKIYAGFIRCAAKTVQDMMDNNIKHLSSPSESYDRSNILQRWGYIGPELPAFIKCNEPGKVFESKPYFKYQPHAPQQFRNSPFGCSIKLLNGTTLIDVGFVDFGITIDSIETLDTDISQGPLTVIGYEMDPFCVAKTLVMLEMMRQAVVQSRSVVEVWLSSLWSQETNSAFREALTTVLPRALATYPKKVIDILKYWAAAATITAQEAIRLQFEYIIQQTDVHFAMKACNLKSEQDRVDFLRYYRTKALYEDATTTLGSVVMNTTSDSIGIKQHFGNCVEAVPTNILMTVYRNSNNGNGEKGVSFLNIIRSYFEEKVSQFSYHLRNGTLYFTPKLGTISIDAAEIINEIRCTNPYVISWSNLCDYIDPTEFHAIVRRASGSDTVHYVHFCNWTQRMYGTDVYDIQECARLYCYSAGLERIERSHALLKGLRKQGCYHVRDICSVELARVHVKKFLRYFFRAQYVICGCFNGASPLTLCSPFTRNIHTAFIMFAYKETGIKSFGLDDYNYLED